MLLIFGLVSLNIVYKQLLVNEPHEKIIEFSTDIVFEPFPTDFNINNEYECSTNDLRLCSISNPLSCFGCKNLTSACVHFKDDVSYENTDGTYSIIPKNTNSDEGYCLSLSGKLVDKCNIYHGKYVLVAINTDTYEYGLFCVCSEPGYIGNVSITGACDVPFICHGKIDNINQPLADINCICNKNEFAMKENDLPVCKIPTILELNTNYPNWNVLTNGMNTNGFLTMPTHRLNLTLAANINTDTIIDPCSIDFFTGEKIMAQTTETSTNTFICVPLNNLEGTDVDIFTLRSSPTERLLAGDVGPDRAFQLKYIYVDFVDRLTATPTIWVTFMSDDNPLLAKALHLLPNSYYTVALGRDIYWGVSFRQGLNAPRPGAYCTANWPTYQCVYKPQRVRVINSYITLNPNYNIISVNINKSQPVPGGFIWGTEIWESYEKIADVFQIDTIKNENDEEQLYHNGLPMSQVRSNLQMYFENLPKKNFILFRYYPHKNMIYNVTSSASDDYTLQKNSIYSKFKTVN